MNPLKAYAQQTRAHASRIDLLLALYDGAIERLEKAIVALRLGDELTALPLLARVQAIVMELAAGVNIDAGDPNSPNLLRLYEYFAHGLATRELPRLESVVKAMATLREGFRAIRAEAAALERGGEIPSLDAPRHVLAVV
jgi:flagellin-specific chaperone FliS